LYYFEGGNDNKMQNKNNISGLHGKVQHYQWGGFDYIPRLLGISNTEHKPFAEYWLGAHVNAPATLESDGLLDAFISQHPEALGRQVQQSFGRLPYLLKVLDVKDMLSIQVHPNKQAAVLSFDAENKAGIPLDASVRNYKDDNHKPELMVALSPFWLLHGFRNRQSMHGILKEVPELSFLLPIFEQQGYKGLYETVMTMEQAAVNESLQPLLSRLIPEYQTGRLQKSDPGFWAARAALTFNAPGKIDRGIFSVYLLNLVQLAKGEAIFQDAGILHAYLEGQNVEIMANSDNVLRGGLTPKHIDVPELMKHVVFEPVEPAVIHEKATGAAEAVFATPAPDFELSRIVISHHNEYHLTTHTIDIFLLMEGEATVTSAAQTIRLGRGGAFVAFGNTQLTIQSNAEAEIYRASVPTTGQA
jgi:mannose-6-phosphate isomerase